jgi:hypothetical protein
MCWTGAAAEPVAGGSSRAQVNVGLVADAIIALAPPAGQGFNAMEAKRRAADVRWGRSVRAGVVKGRLGEARVRLVDTPGPLAEIRPLLDDDAQGVRPALEARGATVAEIACLDYGPALATTVYRVSAPGKAPFTLTVTDYQHMPRGEPSEYTVTAHFGPGRDRFDNVVDSRPGWQPTCH